MSDIANMVGHGFRLGEIECAIGIEQLKKLEKLVYSRQALAKKLTKGLADLPGLQTPVIKNDRTHVYYVYPMQLDLDVVKVSREKIVSALAAEGLSLSAAYQNIHLIPMYQNKIAFGSSGFPWTSDICKREVSYDRGICPNAEYLNDNTFIGLGMCVYDLSNEDIDLIIKAFHKVWDNLDSL